MKSVVSAISQLYQGVTMVSQVYWHVRGLLVASPADAMASRVEEQVEEYIDAVR